MKAQILMMLLVLPLAAKLQAGTILVPEDYSTIQAGLNAAQNGDTVLASQGTYFENLIWPQTTGIKLLNAGDVNSTIIDGGGLGSVIEVSTEVDTTTVISGFTIQGGLATDNIGGSSDTGCGGGIFLFGSASPTISGNYIQNCTALGWGGGIGIAGNGSPVITGNTISDCEAYLNGVHKSGGGGIAQLLEVSSLRITDNTIEACSVKCDYLRTQALGGGVYIAKADNVLISNNTFFHNGFDDNSGDYDCGGAVLIDSGSVTIQGNTFVENNSYYGAGLMLGYFGYVEATVSQCLFAGHTGPSSGGAFCSCINFGAGESTISNCTITGNDLTGIDVWGYHSITIDSTTIAENLYDGIRRYSPGSSIEAHYCSIYDNDGYGVTNFHTGDIDATYCWWGDASGPGGSGTGTGDEVSDYVLYDPWLTQTGIENSSGNCLLELCVTPNPLASNGVVSFNIPEAGVVTLQIFDLSGRIVQKINPGILGTGNHLLDLDASDWTSGVFLIRLNAGNSSVVRMCVAVP